ncbi:hypothetical protein J2S43_003675 [Catenuloplanes nepalensis]|uniref:Uncharacterized protein n=1 Tax=Catenuloplanes nepalensis TaxID=587533 RepID=A0ABT9MUS6_9ACTN|nr:hypothetical protein [Catenuloplanes nepalensis]MDP9795163.1 hypothetical protein [Catenuloplanes nepalensis]
MGRYAPVPLPSGEPELIAGQVRAWVTAAPMRALVAASGGELPSGATEKLLGWLDDFSAAHWDFRRAAGVERDQVRSPHVNPETAATVREAAAALGLADHRRPRRARYDHVLVLGGLGRACLQRVAHAAELLRSGVGTTEVAALGSFRPLSETERAERGLAGAIHEVDAMEVAVRASFGLTADPVIDCEDGPIGHDSWAIRTFPASPTTGTSATATATTGATGAATTRATGVDITGTIGAAITKATGAATTGGAGANAAATIGTATTKATGANAAANAGATGADATAAGEPPARPAVHVLAAPSSEPEKRRARTPDTYEFWARRFGARPGDRILVVTSPIYVPFQHCDAIRMLGLPHGCAIDTVGFDPAHAVPPQPETATAPDRYLQETRSAILSMQRLFAAISAD